MKRRCRDLPLEPTAASGTATIAWLCVALRSSVVSWPFSQSNDGACTCEALDALSVISNRATISLSSFIFRWRCILRSLLASAGVPARLFLSLLARHPAAVPKLGLRARLRLANPPGLQGKTRVTFVRIASPNIVDATGQPRRAGPRPALDRAPWSTTAAAQIT
eukprot:9320395-Pyramimonas_sp.AAC.1